MRRLARRARVRAENARQGFLVVGTGEDIIAAAKASDVGGDVATVEEAGDEAGAAEAPDATAVQASDASGASADAKDDVVDDEVSAAEALKATPDAKDDVVDDKVGAAEALKATPVQEGAAEALDTTKNKYASF